MVAKASILMVILAPKGVSLQTTLLYQKLGVRPRDRLYDIKLIVLYVISMLNVQICIVNRGQSGLQNR